MQQQSVLSVPWDPEQNEDSVCDERGRVQCWYGKDRLSFDLPIPSKIREAIYGSNMPQIVHVPIESPSLGSRFLKDRVSDALPDATFTETIAKRARMWIDNCIEEHSHSKLYTNSSFLPTRLIEVGSTGQPAARLYESKYLPRGMRYTSLSHRWIDGKVLQLKQDNIEALKHEIPLTSISKTFRDAFEVTRMLGINFIWIDSLCIIQDSEKDWVKEAARMADWALIAITYYVGSYERAYCNLSAAASADSEAGLVINRDATVLKSLHLTIPDTSETVTEDQSTARRSFALASQTLKNIMKSDDRPHPNGVIIRKDSEAWLREVNNSPLNRRGWIFQERLLSSRILHFGKTRVFFECTDQQCSEDQPKQFVGSIFGEMDFKSNSPQALLSKLDRNQKDMAKHAANLWAHTVSQYTRCPLTFPSDRLVALAGVAQRYRRLMRLSGDKTFKQIRGYHPNQTVPEYFLGIWLCDESAVGSLCWSVSGELEPRPESLRGSLPTWSFGSIIMGVQHGPTGVPLPAGGMMENLASITQVDAEYEAGLDAEEKEAAMWTGRLRAGAGAIWLEGTLLPVQLSTLVLDEVEAVIASGDQARGILVEAGTWRGNPLMMINGEPQRWAFQADELRLYPKEDGDVSGAGKSRHDWTGEHLAMALVVTRSSSECRVYGLVLEKVIDQKGCYRRAGSFCLNEDDLPTASERSESSWLTPEHYEAQVADGKVRIKLT